MAGTTMVSRPTLNPESWGEEQPDMTILMMEKARHTQWDDCDPGWDEAGPFEAWLRERVKKTSIDCCPGTVNDCFENILSGQHACL